METLIPSLKKHITTVFELLLNKDVEGYAALIIDAEWMKDTPVPPSKFKNTKTELTNGFKDLIDELDDAKVYSSEPKIKDISIKDLKGFLHFTDHNYDMVIENDYFILEINGEVLGNTKTDVYKEARALSITIVKNKKKQKKIKAKKSESFIKSVARYKEFQEDLELNPKSTIAAIEVTEKKLNVSIPKGLKEVYIKHCNGFGESENEELVLFKHEEITGIMDFFQEQVNEGSGHNVFTETHLDERKLTDEEQQLVKQLNENVFIFAVNWFEDQNLDLVLFNTKGQFGGILYDHHNEYSYLDDYLKPFTTEARWHSDFNTFFSELITCCLEEFDEDYDYEKTAQNALFWKED